MVFRLLLTDEAFETLEALEGTRRKKVENCLGRLALNPRHGSLNTHRYERFDKVYGQSVWESYVENNTPAAWRVWWAYGPDQGQITVLLIAPHP